MKEVAVVTLLIATTVLTPLGAARKNWTLFGIGAVCGVVVFNLLFMR